MYLIELSAAVDDAGIVKTFYVSDVDFTTAPTDTPANTAFLPRLVGGGSIAVSAFSAGKTSGPSQLRPGEIEVANIDGELDSWINHSFDGRPLVIRRGSGGAYPAAFPIVMTATVASVEATVSTISIRLRDKALVLGRPVLTTQYAGTNVGPVGLEGLPGDIKGKVKPRIYGKPSNVSPRLVNTSKLTFQVNDGPVTAIGAVYDRGAALTFAADFATSALLTAATVASGEYSTCLAEGLFRTGSPPVGQITADVTAGASAANRRAGTILKALAIAAGLTPAEISDDDVGDLNFVAPYELGLFLEGEVTIQAAMDLVAGSVGGWWAFDTSGKLRMGQLAPPGPVADFRFTEGDILKGFERRVADRDGVPVWRVNVRHSKFWTVQASDLATSLPDARRGELAQEYRTASAEDPTIKLQFAQAGELTIDTLLTSEADAAALAARLLAIHKVRRDLFDMPVAMEVFVEAAVEMMRPVSVDHGRFGLAGGKPFLALGFSLDLGQQVATYSIWG